MLVYLFNLLFKSPTTRTLVPGTQVNLVESHGYRIRKSDGIVLAGFANGEAVVEWPGMGRSTEEMRNLSVIAA